MSNTLAIAAVTTTLRYVLQESLRDDPAPVSGANVTTLRPAQLVTDDELRRDRGLNLYLLQATPNHAWNLTDLPTRRSDGSLARQPLAALDLQYLVTAYGDDKALEPQRFLASAALALATKPVCTPALIDAALATYGAALSTTEFVKDSDLAGQVDLVKLSPAALSLEELSKLWGMLGTQYLLSQVYTATAVLLEATRPVRKALPVREPRVGIRPFRRIDLTSVEVAGGGPAVTGATLLLRGSGLLSALTVIAVGRTRLTPDAGSTADLVRVALVDNDPIAQGEPPVSVSAGVHGVQVLHLEPPRTGEPERVIGHSRALPVTVLPTIGTPTAKAGTLTIPVVPRLHEGQQAIVNFSRLSDDTPGVSPVTVATEPAARAGPSPTPILVDVSGLVAGTWMVRVLVDGAESPPTASTPGGPYDSPAVVIP